MEIFKKFFGDSCDHDYSLIDKEVKEPTINEMMKNGLKNFQCDRVSVITTKSVSRVFKCKKCNKIWIDTIEM